ncbi:MAG: molybdenum cofactor guanylyltransferase [Gammaproteobacteria bacterium]|nr:molybdenum cofactor guanylyltransferase [Gammaproteobacteria bacterium]
MTCERQTITGLVLAGGRATRMGGMDKGLVKLAGRPMVAWVIECLQGQVDELIINANRNQDMYRAMGHQVVSDRCGDFQGPLAGMASGMAAAGSQWLLTAPCDSPLLSPLLAERLRQACAEGADIAVAHDGERLQPVFALLRCSLLGSLQAYLDAGGRKIDRWYAEHAMQAVDFSDCMDTFLNINEPADREQLETRLALEDGGQE